ncbi:Alpha/Beta hydrolase protein [Mycena floridula]|nr:Alpha/Beta hydrolase protein [Mycena floridula]
MAYPIHVLSLILIPPVLFSVYLLAIFPNPPEMLRVHPSLGHLPVTAASRLIYPSDFYPNGNYVTLPYGRVRYWLMGPEKSTKKIVLIHGLSIPAMIWKDIAPELAKRGYRVLLYDLFGRGYSDAPCTKYDAPLYTTQLALLFQHLKWDKADVMGVSMGGGIAAAFVASFPELVGNMVVLLASAGVMDSTDLSRTSKFMSAPLVQTLASSVPVRKYLQKLTNSTTASAANSLDEIVRLQSAHLPGYNAALSSSLRDGPIRGLTQAFKSEAFKGRKVLIVHGTKDRTVPYKYASTIQSLLPEGTHSKIITIEDAGHDLTTTVPDDILKAFDQFVI